MPSLTMNLSCSSQGIAVCGIRQSTCRPLIKSLLKNLRHPARNLVIQATSNVSAAKKPDPFATIEEYRDNPIDLAFIAIFAKMTAKQLGDIPYAPGYDGFVELSREVMKGRNSQQQQELVGGVLGSFLPEEAAQRFRQWFPLSKWSAETNARITTAFFGWLVGPSEVQDVEVDFNGRKETWKSSVKIKKCRYLEQSGCVGMCLNMCKVPTQTFFTNKLGLPVTMNPDFEDLSCEMIFGAVPPPMPLDPAYNQPCFTTHCRIAIEDNKPPCPRIDNDRPKQ